jgi:hypothetical protein
MGFLFVKMCEGKYQPFKIVLWGAYATGTCIHVTSCVYIMAYSKATTGPGIQSLTCALHVFRSEILLIFLLLLLIMLRGQHNVHTSQL